MPGVAGSGNSVRADVTNNGALPQLHSAQGGEKLVSHNAPRRQKNTRAGGGRPGVLEVCERAACPRSLGAPSLLPPSLAGLPPQSVAQPEEERGGGEESEYGAGQGGDGGVARAAEGVEGGVRGAHGPPELASLPSVPRGGIRRGRRRSFLVLAALVVDSGSGMCVGGFAGFASRCVSCACRQAQMLGKLPEENIRSRLVSLVTVHLALHAPVCYRQVQDPRHHGRYG